MLLTIFDELSNVFLFPTTSDDLHNSGTLSVKDTCIISTVHPSKDDCKRSRDEGGEIPGPQGQPSLQRMLCLSLLYHLQSCKRLSSAE